MVIMLRNFARQFLQRPAAHGYVAACQSIRIPNGIIVLESSSLMTSKSPMSLRKLSTITTPQTTCIQTTLVRPHHVQNDLSAVIAGVAIAGAAIGVGKMWWDASSSTYPSKKVYPDRPAVRDIPRDEIVQFFRDLTNSIQRLFTHIPDLEKEIRAEFEKRNIEATEEEFRQAVLSNLYQVMNQVEVQLVEQFGWNAQSMEAAFIKYEHDDEIKTLQTELRTLMQSVFPEQSVDIPESLTSEKVLEILRAMIDEMEIAMRDTLAHAKSEGITDPNKALEEFKMLYLEQVQSMNDKKLKAYGIDNHVLTAAIQKHYDDDSFRDEVSKIYNKQAKAFREMGLEVEE